MHVVPIALPRFVRAGCPLDRFAGQLPLTDLRNRQPNQRLV